MPEIGSQAGSSQFVPKGMRVSAERLAAFTRNRFRIENAGSNTCLPGQIVTVTLPSNTLVDLHSLKMHARFSARGGNQTIWATDYGVLNGSGNRNMAQGVSFRASRPDNMHQLISRMTVSANGTAIQQGCLEYNTVHTVKNLLDRPAPMHCTVDNTLSYACGRPIASPGGTENPFTKVNQTSFETTILKESNQLQGVSNNDGAWTGTGADEIQGNTSNMFELNDNEKGLGHDVVDFVLNDWRGFFKESSVRYLPTDLVGAIQIQLTMADATVLPWVGSAPDGMLTYGDSRALFGTPLTGSSVGKDPVIRPAQYRLDNIYWTIDTISVDQAYGDMLRGKIASFGYISILFKEYYTFHKSGAAGEDNKSNQHRFSLSSGSMDKIYTVMRDARYNSTNLALTPRNHSKDHWTPSMKFICPSLPVHNFGYPYDSHALSDSKYTARPKWHSEIDTGMTYHYKINSVQHPQFAATARDAMWDCAYSHDNTDGPNAGHRITSREDWFERSAIFPLCLNLTDGPLQLMSGYDSRGHSSFVEFNVNGLDPTQYLFMGGSTYSGVGAGGAKTALYKDGISISTIIETTSEMRVGAGLSIAVAR